jgi:transposase
MNKKELRKLSKNELIQIILDLLERFEETKKHLKAFDNPHTPSSKKQKKNTEKKDNNKPRFPGKPKGSNGGGIKLPPPDEVVEHTMDVCPVSKKKLGKPIGYYKKTIVDFPDKPIRIIEHRIMQYISPATGEIVIPKVDLTKGIYGKNLQSIVVMLKNLTNSHDKIADLMRELGAPSFSNAEVQNISDKFADKLEVERLKMLEEIRREPYLNLDETGFRKDGIGGYVWGVFSKTKAILHASMSRARENITKLLLNFKGVIVTDGYNAYDIYPLRQRCWSHLLREFKDYAKNNEEILVQYTRIKLLYEHLKELNKKPPDEQEIAKAKWILKDIVVCLKVIKGASGLATLITNGGDDWFTALYYENVPLNNNHAERELRPIVLLRKTISCYRNEKGKRWIDIVVSMLHTWKLQEKNIFQQLCIIAD